MTPTEPDAIVYGLNAIMKFASVATCGILLTIIIASAPYDLLRDWYNNRKDKTI